MNYKTLSPFFLEEAKDVYVSIEIRELIVNE